jgi:hypothetical protein
MVIDPDALIVDPEQMAEDQVVLQSRAQELHCARFGTEPEELPPQGSHLYRARCQKWAPP